jgi:hypothetical protein
MTLAASLTLAVVGSGAPAAQALSHHQAVAYGRAYAHVVHVFGSQTAGCKLIGPGSTCNGAKTDARILASTDVLHRMFAPKPVYHAVAPTTAYRSASSTSTSSYSTSYSSGSCGGVTPYSGGGQCWAIPYSIVQCESGGTNIPNSSGSGANGYYQLMVGGGGSKSEQDQAAARLWNGGAGRGNWVC